MKAFDMRNALSKIRADAYARMQKASKAARCVDARASGSKGVRKSSRSTKYKGRMNVTEQLSKMMGTKLPKNAGNYGKALIGERVRVYWPLDRKWYDGRIINYTRSGDKHSVRYIDGVVEDVILKKEQVIFPDRDEKLYDTNISDGVIINIANALRFAYDLWGPRGFAVHPKGSGVIANKAISTGRLVGPYIGEVYPSWLWEKKEEEEEEARRESSKHGKVVLPEFWNMRFERPRRGAAGYDILHIDSKNCGKFTSRMSHSCNPNCGTMLAAIGGEYCVAIRALRDITPGEELTIDYNCVTNSIEEFKAAACLCGSSRCRGSFLYVTSDESVVQVVKRRFTYAHRMGMLLNACCDPRRGAET